MFRFLRLLDLILCVGGHSHRKSVLSPVLFCVVRLGVQTGFVNLRISASSGFVCCVGGTSHRKAFRPFPGPLSLSSLGANRFRKMFGALLLLDLFCASVAMVKVNMFFPRFRFLFRV